MTPPGTGGTVCDCSRAIPRLQFAPRQAPAGRRQTRARRRGRARLGRQIDGQLHLAGLPRAERADDANLIVLAGPAGEPEIEAAAATAPLPIIAFDGVQGATLGDREVRLALPYAPVDGVPSNELLAGDQQARQAAALVICALAEGATDRQSMLATIRRLGGFDTHGDPLAPAVWLWRADPAWNLQPVQAL